jgi:hypothetical protein
MYDQVLKIDENNNICFWCSVTMMHGLIVA